MNDVNWYIKPSQSGTYVKMPSPTKYEIELEDLDNGTFRSIATGDMIDTVVSKNWSKIKFEFEGLTENEAKDLITKCSNNPIYAKVEHPIYTNGVLECNFRCSKKSIEKVLARTKLYNVSLNLVQKNKVSGM